MGRVTWREFVGNLHQNAARPEKTLWDLMRSKGSTAETSVTSHMPALRRTTGNDYRRQPTESTSTCREVLLTNR
jgi:hypothetical protein